MSVEQTHLANAYEVEMDAAVGTTDLVFSVASTSGSPTMPAWMVCEPDDENQREYIKFSSKTASSFTVDAIGDRYGDGSAAGSGLSHASGSILRVSPLKQHHDELWDKILEIEHAEDHAARHESGAADGLESYYVPKTGGIFTGGVTVNTGGITITGASSFSTNVTISGDASVGGNLTVTGTTTFTGAPSYASDPASANILTRKSYVDDKDTAHSSLTSPHSASIAATASRLIVRDANARAKVADPSADGDIANKGYVDTAVDRHLIEFFQAAGTETEKEFSSIPDLTSEGFHHLLLMGRLSVDTGSGFHQGRMTINGDTAGNYYYTLWHHNGSAGVVTGYESGLTAIRFNTGTGGTIYWFIPNYRTGSSFVNNKFESTAFYGTAAANAENRSLAVRYDNSGPVTSLKLTLLGPGAPSMFGTTKLSLYALK